MKIEIDWSQNSTKRGAVWLIFGLFGLIGWLLGKDTTQLMTIGATVVGGMGLAIKD